MSKFAVIWDLETIPDLAAFKRMCGTPDISDAEAQELHGDKFAKLPLHLIACIGAVIAERGDWGWRVTALGAPHIGHHFEAEIITRFVSRLEELRPQLVAFNSHGFDLPVLRYRAMVHSLSAPGLNCRSYFNRYSEDCLYSDDAAAKGQPQAATLAALKILAAEDATATNRHDAELALRIAERIEGSEPTMGSGEEPDPNA